MREETVFGAFLLVSFFAAVSFLTNEVGWATAGMRWALLGALPLAVFGIMYVFAEKRFKRKTKEVGLNDNNNC